MAFTARTSRSSTHSVKVKVFRSLLLLSLLEGVLWSLCLFHSCSAASLAYYQRETVNLKSTTASRVHALPPPSALDTRALLLALREEARARQRTLDCSASLPAARDQIAQLASLRAFLPAQGEQPSETGADSAAALTVAAASPLRAHARRAL